MTAAQKTPESTSSDYDAMCTYWDMVSAILGGTPTMRLAGQTYLPKFTNESRSDYEIRLKNAKFTNLFGDILSTLASKPFEQELTVDKAEAVDDLIEDIDGQGNHVQVFASQAFYDGIANAVHWCLVDYTKDVPQGATVAAEKALGARPYWVQISARSLLAVYSENVAGKETIVHARIREDVKERDGYGEAVKKRVRVLNRELVVDEQGNVTAAKAATWELFEKQKLAAGGDTWTSIGTGSYSIGIIPLVPFVTGRRYGASWVFKPPLADAAYLQIEHYQQESGLKHKNDLNNFSMLAGQGVEPPIGEDGQPAKVPSGPQTVLYAPPSGDKAGGRWEWLDVKVEGLKFSLEYIQSIEAQLRELGRQPLTAQSGNITTITAAFAGDKAHTVIEAWALNFKDFLENCLKITAMWRKTTIEPVVQINTDFSLSLKEDTGVTSLDAAQERNALSWETWFMEMKRRGIIGPNVDKDEERQRILDEIPGEPTDDEIEAALPTPKPASERTE
jgi:hypothetical protein